MPWTSRSAATSTMRPKFLRALAAREFWEIVEDGRGGTYRAVYTIKFKEAVFVLHVFQKKSKHGIATPKMDTDIIRERLKLAEQLVKEMHNA
ncbi:MAG: type II toxin-antitoxin system RelE/ParE family toxin [Sulfuricaulis sp.]